MEAIKKFLRFESPHFPVSRKCCCCFSVLRGVIIYAYLNLVLTLISLPVLIYALVEMRTDGNTSVPLSMPEPEMQLPLNITLTAFDVVLTVMLLIGIHKKRNELLKICFYAGILYNFLATCLAVAYFSSENYLQNIIDIPFVFFNLYMLFVIYNGVYVLEQDAARAADVQYVTYRDQQGL